jgi:hypothetical protein
MKMMLKCPPASLVPLATLFVFSGCVHRTDQPAGPLLEHRISYSAKGSRSEARHGSLFFQGEAVPDVYETVADDGITYRFRTRQQMWGDDGYHPGAPVEPAPASQDAFQTADRNTGWYHGPHKKPGTPVNWVYVEWSNGRAFVAPDQLDALADTKNLPPISRIARQRIPLPIRR